MRRTGWSAAVVLLALARAQPSAAHPPGPIDLRPDWLIELMDGISAHRDRAREEDFFEELYDKDDDELAPLRASGGPCGPGGFEHSWRMLRPRKGKDGSVALRARPTHDLFFGSDVNSIAYEVHQEWSWDACVFGRPRRLAWFSADGKLLAAVDERGSALVADASGVVTTPSEPPSPGLVTSFPCTQDSDCVLLRENCSAGRQRSPYSRRAPYFEVVKTRLQRDLAAQHCCPPGEACYVPESSPYDAMRVVCREAACDVVIPRR